MCQPRLALRIRPIAVQISSWFGVPISAVRRRLGRLRPPQVSLRLPGDRAVPAGVEKNVVCTITITSEVYTELVTLSGTPNGDWNERQENMKRPSVGVVGAGRVGAVLAARLRAVGYPIFAVSGSSSASQLRISTLLPGVEVADPIDIAERSDIVILAVPDDRLARVAASLASAIRPGQVVLHASGSHGTGALRSLASVGARPIAFHPAMTFTGTSIDLDRSCVFGLTAADAERELAEQLVADLGGTPMWMSEADRATYHAALAHGANHLSTIVTQAMDLLRGIGAEDPAAVLRPLLTAALDNTLTFGEAALTGPVARGDVATVASHLAAINDDSTQSSYRALASATADRAEQSGALDPRSAATLQHILTKEVAR